MMTDAPKVYITMTTLPERLLSSFFNDVVFHLRAQTLSYEKIILNIPHICKINHSAYTIPQWVIDSEDILINRCEDVGPATKLLGYYNSFLEDDIICVVDDDIIYLPDMLENLYKAALDNPGALISTSMDEPNCPAAYSGFLFLKKDLPINDEDIENLLSYCYYVDDTWIGKICKRKNIPVIGISTNGFSSIDIIHTRKHPDWYELNKDTNRKKLVKRCLCESRFSLFHRLKK